MRLRVLLALVGCLLVGAGAPRNAPLLGTWEMTAGDVDGQEVPPALAKRVKLVLKADRLVFAPPLEVHTRSGRPGHTFRVGEGDVFEVRYKVDAARKPKAIDFIQQSDEGGPKLTVRGVYLLDGDTLKICVPSSGEGRPREFPSRPQPGVSRYFYKRSKPG